MKLIDSLRQAMGIQVRQIDQADRPELRARFMRGQPIPSAMKAEEYLKAYKGWVYTAVSKIAEEVSNLELVLMRRINQDEAEIVETHPALDLIHKVNPLYTSYQLWEATAGYYKLLGESYWWLTGPKNRPNEIWVLRPDWLKINDSKSKIIESYSYGPPGEDPEIIKFEEVIPFRDFNPLNPFRGFGGVKAAAEAVDTENDASLYNRMFFKNGGRPGGALETENALTDEQYDRIREEWERVHKGSENSWKVAILEGGLKWKDVGLAQKDMDYIEGRRYSRDEILAIFKVPKPIVAINDDVNRAAAKEARAVFLENTIDPILKNLVAYLNEFFLPRYGDPKLFFNYKSMVPNDAEAMLRKHDSGLRNGWMTRNEVRAEQGLDPKPGGDTLYIPFGYVELMENGVDNSNSASETADPNAKKSKRINLAKNLMLKIAPISDQEVRETDAIQLVTESAKSLLTKMLKHKYHDKAIDADEQGPESEQNKSPREIRWRTIVKRTDDREATMIHKLTDLFTEQQRRVNDQIDTGVSKCYDKDGAKVKAAAKLKATINDITDLTKDNDIFAAPLMELIRAIIETEGILQIQDVAPGSVFYMAAKEVVNYLKKDGAKFIDSINEETGEQLRQQLSDGVAAQESINQLRARVETVFDDARGFRSERIARTEVIRASNFATNEAYRQSEVVEAKEWLTAHDEMTCPFCAPLDGTTVSLEEVYYEKGDTITGTDKSTGNTVRMTVGLTDVGFPPLHPNCRCTIIPVLKSNKQMANIVNKGEVLTGLVSATIKETRRQLAEGGEKN